MTFQHANGHCLDFKTGQEEPRPMYTRHTTCTMLKRQQIIDEPVAASTATIQASMSSIPAALAHNAASSGTVNTLVAVTVVLGVVFIAFALFLIYWLYVRRLEKEERKHYRKSRMHESRRGPVWPGSRRPAIKTGNRGADCIETTCKAHFKISWMSPEYFLIASSKSRSKTSSSSSDYSTSTTSSTDLGSMGAVLKGPVETIDYPSKTYWGGSSYNSSLYRSESGTQFSQYDKHDTRSSSPASSYQSALSGWTTQSQTLSNWPSDRPGSQPEHAPFDDEWNKAMGWSSTAITASNGSCSSKLLNILALPFFRNQ